MCTKYNSMTPVTVHCLLGVNTVPESWTVKIMALKKILLGIKKLEWTSKMFFF